MSILRTCLLGAAAIAALAVAAPAMAQSDSRDAPFLSGQMPYSVPQEFARQLVDYAGPEHPGTVVVDPTDHFLYLVRDDGTAIRYGIGVGREGFGWSGQAQIKRKAEWPTWTPPSDMRLRQPDLPVSMVGGPDNPLGARAMYLFQGDRDTMYRIHGTNEPDSIGKSLSSGCIRMMNADVIDLFRRIPMGTDVVVLPLGVDANSPRLGRNVASNFPRPVRPAPYAPQQSASRASLY